MSVDARQPFRGRADRAGAAKKGIWSDGSARVEQAVPPRRLCAAALPGGEAERGSVPDPGGLFADPKGRGGAKGAVLLCAARRQHYERQ